ncbi:MAG: Asp23/Gls24 family envelope stress response protein [Lachnospiraceae bacterium]|nr:Asp23/Gls24 family envelope stress response protein [Lachnospiraceae bacterium]MBR1914271.1 Asp23/Gls24 family envelope stress response protein [Lachnospiraceae bacterium]
MAANKEEIKSAEKSTGVYTLDSGSRGEVKVADDVVASIAALAAAEVDGINGMTGNIGEKLMKSVGIRTGSGSGVRVDIAGNMVRVDMAVVLGYGYNIMETSRKVQDKVKSAIETMTGLNVTDVNIRITGINNEARNDK